MQGCWWYLQIQNIHLSWQICLQVPQYPHRKEQFEKQMRRWTSHGTFEVSPSSVQSFLAGGLSSLSSLGRFFPPAVLGTSSSSLSFFSSSSASLFIFSSLSFSSFSWTSFFCSSFSSLSFSSANLIISSSHVFPASSDSSISDLK